MHFTVIIRPSRLQSEADEAMSGRRELDPLSSPWQGDILPVNYARYKLLKCSPTFI